MIDNVLVPVIKSKTGHIMSKDNCRIHHMTASMTTIDLIIKPRTELFGAGDYTFKLAAPSILTCALSIYFSSQFLPLLLFSSYPLPTLTMDHIRLSKCDGL